MRRLMVWPSIHLEMPSAASAAATVVDSSASAAVLTVPRSLPLTCTAIATSVRTRYLSSNCGQGS